MSINMSNLLNTQLSARHAEMMAKHRETIAERIAAANVRREQAQAARQENNAAPVEEVAGSQAHTRTMDSSAQNPVDVQASAKALSGWLKTEFHNNFQSGLVSAERDFEQIVEKYKAAEDKSNRLQSEFKNLSEWKQDRIEVGLFAKYQEAGDKVQMPVRVTLDNKGKANDLPSEKEKKTPSLQDGVKANGIGYEAYQKARAELSERLEEYTRDPNYTPHAPGRWTDSEVKEYYGNYFVHTMERFVGKVMHQLDSIDRYENRISQKEERLAGEDVSNNDRVSLTRDIGRYDRSIARSEEALNRTLSDLRNWADKNNVSSEAERFFGEFTRDYYEEEQSLEMLTTLYG